MIYLGVDPGKTGGLAMLDKEGKILLLVSFSNLTPHEIYKAFGFGINCADGRTAVIEGVNAFPGQGVHSMFVFGENYGMLQGFLIAREIPFTKVSPVTWKKAMGLAGKTGKTTRTERKKLSRALAQRLFPQCEEINDSTAEALLLAEYCRRIINE